MNTPGPSWKVARVQPKGTQNDRFSPSFLPLPPVSFFQFLPPLPIRFAASCLFFPSFSCLLTRFLSPTGLSRSFRPTRSLATPPLFATTQSVIPAHSVYCVFSFSLFYAFPPLPRLSQSFRLPRSLARISQLAVLIHDAQDLARSPSGWIKTSALIAYNGPSIPGNFDTHSGEIVNTSTFLLKVHGLSQPLTDEYIKGLVSKDNLRGPKRFILGLSAPGKRTNSTQRVIRLTPIPAADPNAGAAGASSLRTSRPLTLDEAEPFGVYFFQSSMLRVLTREGIRPKKKSQPGRSSLLKVQPTDNPGPVGSSQLRGRSDACFLIDMHASIKAGTEWIMYTNDGCYGTDHIPITPQFLLVAFRFTPRGSEEIWSAHSAVAPAANTHSLPCFCPPPFLNLGSLFHLSLNPVGHSGPLGSWLPLSLFSHSPCFLCHHSPTSSLPL